jgi:hypothetical protein
MHFHLAFSKLVLSDELLVLGILNFFLTFLQIICELLFVKAWSFEVVSKIWTMNIICA